MPSPFDITTVTTTISLDNKREGTAVFTATNRMRRHIHAAAKMVTQPPEAASWLTILPAEAGSTADGKGRDFPVGSVQQIVIKVAVPPTGTPGVYSMKLVVADDVNPDENFTESPDVSFTVPAVIITPPPPFPVWIIPTVLIGILMIVIIILLATRNPPPPLTPTATPIPPTGLIRTVTPFVPTFVPPFIPTEVPGSNTNLVAGRVMLDPPQPACGQPFTVFFDIANLGKEPTTISGVVSLVDIVVGDNSMLSTGFTAFPVLQPGETYQVRTTLQIYLGIKQEHDLTLVIDPYYQIPETSKADNQTTIRYVLDYAFCET